MGARRGGGATAPWGTCPTPTHWNLKRMTSYGVSVQNTLDFSLAPSALASYPQIQPMTLKESRKCSFAPSARRKINYFLPIHAVFPSGTVPRGAHEQLSIYISSGL